MKLLLIDGSAGSLVVSKVLMPHLNFSFCDRISLLQIATKLSPRGWGRPRWSRGYHIHHWILDSRVETRPGSVDFLRALKF